MRIAVAQINSGLADFKRNLENIYSAWQLAQDQGAQVLLLPELALCGYPPEDLLLLKGFRAAHNAAFAELLKHSKHHTTQLIVGHLYFHENNTIFNTASRLCLGEVVSRYYKRHLPTYSVFDEARYFGAGNTSCRFRIDGVECAILICEDAWDANTLRQTATGVEVVFILNASPYSLDKDKQRKNVLQHGRGAALVYCNAVGGQDELVFDGNSFLLDIFGHTNAQLPPCQSLLQTFDWRNNGWQAAHKAVPISTGYSATLPLWLQKQFEYDYQTTQKKWGLSLSTKHPANQIEPIHGFAPATLARDYAVLLLGLADYVRKNGFSQVVLGLSGGVDSALVLALAVDALGANNVQTFMLPTRYTIEMSMNDAQTMALAFAVKHHVVPIEDAFITAHTTLSEHMSLSDITQQNLQARLRGLYLMAFANENNALLLSTGNKSELACGYCTLYGDMAGAFAPIKDVYKTKVYALAAFRNAADQPFIPMTVFERPPSAELAPDQKDSDSLPPYEVLDVILKTFIEDRKTTEEIIAMGYEADVVSRVTTLLRRSEYKRQQSAVGSKITPVAFGKDWRMPISRADIA